MNSKALILELVNNNGLLTTNDIVGKLSISRQAAARYLSSLVAEGKIAKLGSTRSARYIALSAMTESAKPIVQTFK